MIKIHIEWLRTEMVTSALNHLKLTSLTQLRIFVIAITE